MKTNAKITALLKSAKNTLQREVLNIEAQRNLSKDQKVKQISILVSSACAGIAIQPIPFADFFLLTPLQGFMGKKIADIRGYKISEAGSIEVFKELIALLGLGLLAQQLAIGAYKTVLPVLGGFTTIPLVFALSYAMAQVMDYYFVQKVKGEKIDPELIKQIYQKAKAEGKTEARKHKESIKNKGQELCENQN